MLPTLALLSALAVPAEAERPNVLLVLSDDQGYGDFSLHGNPILKTPNLDAFAKANTRFERFYVSPLCAPTRASLLTGRKVRSGIAMTGEITLRGNVLKVGGIKEKVLGAHRAGISTVILPDDNMKDLEEVPDAIRTHMIFAPVERIDQVLQLALEEAPAEAAAEGANGHDASARDDEGQDGDTAGLPPITSEITPSA